MTTPPSGNDPYGQPGQYGQQGQNPYGQGNPYGGQYGAPHGQPGYGAGHPGSPGEQAQTDGVSVASFVLSLLCCTGLIGLILGFVGLSRTKNGQRKGRGFAIAGIALGALSVIAGIGAIIWVAVFANSFVTPDNAEVGQCVDVESDGGEVSLREKECTEEHDAEIVAVAEVTDDNIDEINAAMVGYCVEAISEEDLAKLTDHLDSIQAVTENPDDVEVGDHLVCYVEPDSKLDESIL